MLGLSQKERHLLRWSGLKTERSSWLTRYETISQFLLPYSGRFTMSDRNRGDVSFNNIIDETGTYALDTLSAGMMAGMTSPARPWFRLATSDRELMEFEPVKLWLNEVTELMRDIFARSNTYRSLHTMYEELGAFATAVNIVEDDFDAVIHNNVLTAGEYAIAVNDKGQIDTCYREFEMTLMNVVEKFVLQPDGSFDWSRVSANIKNAWDTHRGLDSWIPVLHAIEPRKGRDTYKKDAKNMPWSSCYIETARGSEDKFLRESGYKRFPALGTRWHTRGGDIYGNGPSFRALGSIKQLQHEQLRKGQGIDYMSLPPIQLPTEMKNAQVDTLPGGVSYFPMGGAGQGAKTLFEVNINLDHLLADIQDVRQRINRAFYADLFLMLSQDQRRQPVTAREIAERHEEKLLMLGPVLERLHNEMLQPLIDLTFARVVETGIVPQPPQEMQGMELKIEFVSTLAQAQRLVGLGSIDRMLGVVAMVAPVKPDILDKLDTDQLVDKVADLTGVDPSLIVADDKVALIRADRAEQQAAMQQAAAMPAGAKAAKDLSDADTEGKNALTDILKQFTGYTTEGAIQ